MAKHPDTYRFGSDEAKRDTKPKEHAYNTPVPDGVQPRINKYDDGKNVSDVGLSDAIVESLTGDGIVNVGRLRRVRDIDLDADSVSLGLIREKVPFEVRPGEKVLVPVEDRPGEWEETDSRENRSKRPRRV